jgi:VWFA-related protein
MGGSLRSASTLAAAASALFVTSGVLPSALAALTQQAIFRSSVELVAIDVQVVDDDGNPVSALGPESFDVSINGRRRRVVSAEFIRHGEPWVSTLSRTQHADLLSEPRPIAEGVSAGVPPAAAMAAFPRLIVIAIDDTSFEIGHARAAVEAADRFVAALGPDDLVGLFVYPSGPRIPPSTERAALRRALNTVVGHRQALRSQYNLKASEIVDITAQSAIVNALGVAGRARATLQDVTLAAVNPLLEVQQRECPTDAECASRIFSEASALALHLEGQASMSLGGLEDLLQAMRTWPGRKSVVLVSAGVVVSDRPGGRPDVGDLARVMGQTAAQANATVYTIQIDPTFTGAYAASQRRVDGAERDRDRAMFGHWLEQFSDSAGGMLINVPVGGGDFAFERVLRETSAHYLLGVEPAEADRDDRPRQLKVRVARDGVTVRSRQWVVVPGR